MICIYDGTRAKVLPSLHCWDTKLFLEHLSLVYTGVLGHVSPVVILATYCEVLLREVLRGKPRLHAVELLWTS